MKIIHTADWHLGRQFHNVSLLDDQAHVLDQLVELVSEKKADVVVIAGDVYDRSVPPAAAVRLLDKTLHRLTTEAKATVVMIAGNHDSAVRLATGSREMEKAGVYIRGPLDKSVEPIVIEDEHGPVYFCPLPYADPSEVRVAFKDDNQDEEDEEDEIRTHEAALEAMGARIRSHLPPEGATRTVAIAHCWVEGGSNTESERPLTVGGTGQVFAGCFHGFSYTALGHLHRPQSVGKKIHYSGSLLKYSFSEVDHKKSVTVVDLDADGEITCERVELKPIRDLRIIEGSMEELLNGPAEGESADDYLLVRLSDTGAILDAMGKLRGIYPNVLHIERPGLYGEAGQGEANSVGDHRQRSELDMVKAFYREMRNADMPEDSEELMKDVIKTVRDRLREASA